MCEIAVLDPDQCSIESIHQVAGKFNKEQGDGLGFVLIKNDGDSFSYETYKTISPHWQTIYSFLKRNIDSAWRIVVHGRAGTCGGVNREAAHPIKVDCEHCSFDWVVHNGSIRRHRNIRPGLISHGHEFTTSVDSEILAHKVQELPESIDDHDSTTYSFTGNLHYLLFSDDGILVRTGRKYHLTDDFTMTCSLNFFDDHEAYGLERNTSVEWMRITPGDEEPTIETKEHTTRSSYRSSGINSQSNLNNGAWTNNNRTQSETTEQESTESHRHTVSYQDHSEYDNLTVIKVAPGVMRVIDDSGFYEDRYVYKDQEPRLYYWYAPEHPPENVAIDTLSTYADSEQSNVDEFVDDSATQTVAEAISEETENIDDQIEDHVAETVQSIHGTI